MTQKLHPWENPEQDYARTLAKRRSERRYRSLQLVKTLKILLTESCQYFFIKKMLQVGDKLRQ